jgi:cathepsin B
MKSVIASVFATVTLAGEFEDIASYINNLEDNTWTAEAPTHRFGSMDDVRTVCGTWTKGHPKFKKINLPVVTYPEDMAVPEAFDARTNWASCTVISKIRDQSACGSCWAFGSTEAFEDSRCVSTGQDIEYSTMDTAGCCRGFLCGESAGCNGGQPSAALQWMSLEGVVTGKSYFQKGDGTSCKDYEFAPCAHHVPPSSKYPACPEKEYRTRCEKKCTETGYNTTYTADKTKGHKAVSFMNTADMQKHIMTNGPLAVAFTVYGDFPTYKSGVYTHKTGQALGGHAVEMIGWGMDGATPYWIIKNSWNEQWGDGGTFKIKRGNDECGIEDDVTGILFK